MSAAAGWRRADAGKGGCPWGRRQRRQRRWRQQRPAGSGRSGPPMAAATRAGRGLAGAGRPGSGACCRGPYRFARRWVWRGGGHRTGKEEGQEAGKASGQVWFCQQLLGGGASCAGCRVVCARGASSRGAPPRTPRPVAVASRVAGAAAASYVNGVVAARREAPRALLLMDTAVLTVQPVSVTKVARRSDAARRCVSTAWLFECMHQRVLHAPMNFLFT